MAIKNFKSHINSPFEFSSLNILTGINGTGKSSVFQALLLLRQSFHKNRLAEGIDLNKPLCSIGQASDAIYQFGTENIIEFQLETDNIGKVKWQFPVSKPEDTFLLLKNDPDISGLPGIGLFNNQFQYLGAGRLAPQESYPMDTYSVSKQRQISLENGQAELIAHFLYHFKSEKIKLSSLKHPQAMNDTLIEQISAWTGEISKYIQVLVLAKEKSFEIKYKFNRENNAFPTAEMSAENVGFGITYALPVITAILSSGKKSILLIENPESHLHPRGQARLAELIARAAQAGIQIFIETHSDHIINGTLVAVKRFQEEGIGIDYNNVRIYYFDRDETKHCSIVHNIPVLENGRIKNPPQGFFDQFKIDIKTLLGF